MGLAGKIVSKVWTFKSSSGKGTYETLAYTDGATSCNCPGWTRRVAADGSRSCKHTRLVDQSLADDECISSHEYQAGPTSSTKITLSPKGEVKKVQKKGPKSTKASEPAAPKATVRKIIFRKNT